MDIKVCNKKNSDENSAYKVRPAGLKNQTRLNLDHDREQLPFMTAPMLIELLKAKQCRLEISMGHNSRKGKFK
jgi:hypothetical protein